VTKKTIAVKKYFFINALMDVVLFVLVDKCILLGVNKRLKKPWPAF
jgi:hypothetical protein